MVEEIKDNPKIITMKAREAIMMILERMPRLETLGKCPKARKEAVGRSTKVRRHLVTTKVKVANNLNNKTTRKTKKQMRVIKISLPTLLKKSQRQHQETRTTHPHSSTRSIRLCPH